MPRKRGYKASTRRRAPARRSYSSGKSRRYAPGVRRAAARQSTQRHTIRIQLEHLGAGIGRTLPTPMNMIAEPAPRKAVL